MFDTSEFEIYEIKEKLFLGSRPKEEDLPKLRIFDISHILTIEAEPLPTEFSNKLVCLYHRVLDVPETNILKILESTYHFIDEALLKGAIFVHCHAGRSRSVAIVAAYLMKKENIEFDEALKMIRIKIPAASPNEGFVKQLHLYHQMEYKLDPRNKDYRKLRMENLVNEVWISDDALRTYFKEMNLAPSEESPIAICARCSFQLTQMGEPLHYCPNLGIYIEPQPWMNLDLSKNSDKIKCLQCGHKVGSYTWRDDNRRSQKSNPTHSKGKSTGRKEYSNPKDTICHCNIQVYPSFFLSYKAVHMKMPSTLHDIRQRIVNCTT